MATAGKDERWQELPPLPPRTAPQIAFAERLVERRRRVVEERPGALPGGRHPLLPAGPEVVPVHLVPDPRLGREGEARLRAFVGRLASGRGFQLGPAGQRRVARLLREDAEERPFAGIIVYQRAGETLPELPEGIAVAAVGAPMAALPKELGFPQIEPEAHGRGPIVGIIDDGIGFLNRRFRRRRDAALATRFAALWLQTFDAAAPNQPGAGRVLSAAEIDAMLAAPDEALVYNEVNAPLSGFGRRSTDFRFSHGTHVTDLAAGADPDATDAISRRLQKATLVGVQLAPFAVEETSGKRLEHPILEGLQFILEVAEALDPLRPVFVNLSFGVTAGPKDGTAWLPRSIRAELAAWNSLPGRRAEMTFAFGNAYRSRLVARRGLQPGETLELDWRVQPGSTLPTTVEVRLEGFTSLDGIEIGIGSPAGVTLPPVPLADGQRLDLEPATGSCGEVGRVAPEAENGQVVSPGFLYAALAPTEPILPQEKRAAGGRWRLRLRNAGGDAVMLRAEVQRGDTPPGYKPAGRQSYLDHEDSWAWDQATMDWTDPRESPITREGTHSSYLPIPKSPVMSAGAAVPGDQDPPLYDEALYTAEGGPWCAHTPSVSAPAEGGWATPGVLASGTISGSVIASNGTSAAAPQIVRHRAAGVPLAGKAVPPPRRPRMGDPVLEPVGDRPRPRG